jgi:hypothetical protein
MYACRTFGLRNSTFHQGEFQLAKYPKIDGVGEANKNSVLKC